MKFATGEIQPSTASSLTVALKGETSKKPMPMDGALLDWRGRCPYNQGTDYDFASAEKRGNRFGLAARCQSTSVLVRCRYCTARLLARFSVIRSLRFGWQE